MERIGIVDDLREAHESVVSRLSPTARHQAFPQKYARPVPRGELPSESTSKLLSKIQKLTAELDAAKAEIEILRFALACKQEPSEDPTDESADIPVKQVMQRFCDRMNAEGLMVGDEMWSLTLLRSPRRAHAISHPRHVCMWLVRTICSRPSFPKIGFAFGGRDHTSVMHALRRAPAHLSRYPALLKVATDVLRSYGIILARLEAGGQP